MTEPTTTFFQELADRGREPALKHASGTIRFDLKDGAKTTRWMVAIDKGDVAVSRRNAKADCVVRIDAGLFDGIASGEVNLVPAILRGALSVEGDRGLLLAFQRLFPGPPRRAS